MTDSIEAIFFDVNGTLRGFAPCDENRRREKIAAIQALTGIQTSSDELDALLTSRMRAYRAWARASSNELSEIDVWIRWMLPDQPSETIRELAPRLHGLWREATGIRVIFPGAKDVLLELFRRGYHLGIASNTLGSAELASALRASEIAGLFETVVLSSEVGERKPRPGTLLEGARRIGIDPSRCAYVGNRADRDLPASREAGFGRAILIGSLQPERANASSADSLISHLDELLGLFPPVPVTRPRHTYNSSLSTMWARHNVAQLRDFFEVARRLGFASAELNHQINSSMLEGIDLPQYPLSSIHEPCPADISTEQLKERDWLISSPDENCRKHGVDAIKRTGDLARHLQLPIIVVHCGMVSTDMSLEQKLRELLRAGHQTSEQYSAIREELVRVRGSSIGQHMASVKKSLQELLAYCEGLDIRLGLENRYHYFDIPNPDEMEDLLSLAGPSRLGFVYDVGHAQALDRLGFYRHEEWLRRFSARIIETHLHDVQGTTDHLAPGSGEVDFDMVASYLPPGAVRTLELQSTNTPDQLRAGLQYLAQHGCIQPI